ncbi:hypothetical protein BEWA_051790 [Theileria equi strain WA]|uniref:Uncharacterized protein n=1 Tax=Theileria equi strain WA TaxID=1537102 RepID=L1LCZ5_THEEQ|nr:hypothetical protein BEWA_051790 [Theileria equi strain WA]EKX73125.1 hypothetical protein BEWA_051790 [Theileria equi strain WA]|eukprot:XP_004832577.1 hypothetical protein BEWA_051790 [Theileria equi strain WA]
MMTLFKIFDCSEMLKCLGEDMSQVSQNSMMWQVSKSWSVLADTLGELSEPDMAVKSNWEASSWEVEEVLTTTDKGDVGEVEVVASLAVRESQDFLDGLASWSSPGKVSTALEALDILTTGDKVSNMGTMMETLDDGTVAGKVNESSRDSEDADSRDQSNNSVHCVFMFF